MKLPNVLVLKFEDLIGPEFGGSDKETQLNTYRKIIKFCGKSVPEDEVQKVADNIGGGTLTFLEGNKKHGQWKNYYTKQHIIDFKERHNKLLLDLGYETDENWDKKQD